MNGLFNGNTEFIGKIPTSTKKGGKWNTQQPVPCRNSLSKLSPRYFAFAHLWKFLIWVYSQVHSENERQLLPNAAALTTTKVTLLRKQLNSACTVRGCSVLRSFKNIGPIPFWPFSISSSFHFNILNASLLSLLHLPPPPSLFFLKACSSLP